MLVTVGLLVAIGSQFATGAINHKQSSKQMKKLQAMQLEYEEAVQREGFERAWEKYNQLCAVQKEIEKELHQRRIDNIEQSFNRYLDITAYSQALKNWPLRVLPFVMKEESLLCNSGIESNTKIALHCMLTRGNDDSFNKAIFRELEMKLSQHFNLFWGAASSHPILFYSGAWKELHDASAVVDNLYNQLEQLPSIVISPWIDEENEFYFKVSVWGIPNVEMRNAIYKPEGVIYTFKQKQKEYTKEDVEQIVTELSPVLAAFIGFIADQYYWRFNNTGPMLPLLIDANMDALQPSTLSDFKQQYVELLDNYISDPESMILHPELSIGLCNSLGSEINKKDYLHKIFIAYCQRFNKEITSMEEAIQLKSFTKTDLPFFKMFIQTYTYDDYRDIIENIIQFLIPSFEIKRTPLNDNNLNYELVQTNEFSFNDDIIKWAIDFVKENNISGLFLYIKILANERNNTKLKVQFVDKDKNVIIYRHTSNKIFHSTGVTSGSFLKLFQGRTTYGIQVEKLSTVFDYLNKQ